MVALGVLTGTIQSVNECPSIKEFKMCVSSGGDQLKFLLVDDHRLVADAMKVMLETLDDSIEIQVSYSTSFAITLAAEQRSFDLVLTDLYLPGIDGFQLLQSLRNRRIFVPVIVFSASEDAQLMHTAFELGAAGFCQKSIPGREMFSVIRHVLEGHRYFPGLTVENAALESSMVDPVILSTRQTHILKLIASGHVNKQIALIENISEATVKYHVSKIFKYLAVNNRMACVYEARMRGLL